LHHSIHFRFIAQSSVDVGDHCCILTFAIAHCDGVDVSCLFNMMHSASMWSHVYTGTRVTNPYIWTIRKFLIFRKFHCRQKVFDFVSSLFYCCSGLISIFSWLEPRWPFTGITREHPARCFGMPLFAAIVAISFKLIILLVTIAIASASTRKFYFVVVVVVSSSVVPILLFGTFVRPMSMCLTILANSVKCQKCDLMAFFCRT
jgi:hypothetical protein